jgi:hypothetical protein
MKEFMTHRRRHGGALVVALLAAAGPLAAQNPNAGQMAEQYAQNARANAQLTRQYTWQMRVALTYKDEAQPPQLYQMNWAPDGTLQKTLISAPPEEKKRRGLRKHIAESEIADFKKWLGDLTELVKQYMAPTPGQMMDFYSKATMTPAPNGGAAAIGTNFIQPGDKVTYYLDPATHQPTSYSFRTTLQGDTVSANVIYGTVAGGPQYASQITVAVLAKQVTMVVQNFNYLKQ